MLKLLFSISLAFHVASAAAEKTKVVFISGKPSHGPMAHEHRAGNMLLAKRLNEANLGIEALVLPENGYPKDPGVLEDAATIVVFCTGHQNHLLNPHLREFDALMKKGTGVVMIHWATEAKLGMPSKKFLEWMGGFCDLNWSVNPHWAPQFENFPDHPVANGLKPFSVDDEWYYHMRFVGDLEGVTPILSDLPPPGTLKRPDGPRSGNPHVRRAVADGKSQHVAWAYERPDGIGRGFGFTGAHNHVSWKNDMFRKVVLNAILWTARVEVPENGVDSPTPTAEELQKNLDDKPARKPRPAKERDPKTKAESNVSASAGVELMDLNEARLANVEPMNREKALAILAKTLQEKADAETRSTLLNGMLLGLEGQRNVEPPDGWRMISAQLEADADEVLRDRTLQLNQIFGDEEATQKAIAKLENVDAGISARQSALASLLTQRRKELLPILEDLLAEDELRIEAIRGFSTLESPRAPRILLNRYPKWDSTTQQVVVETLATRKPYAKALLEALESGRIPREAIPAYVARSLSAMLGEAFDKEFGVQPLSEDKEAMIAKYKSMATPEAMVKADAAAGRVVYQRVCMACHVMFGEGGIVGPELTGSNRADLNYLLLNILYPNEDIADAYKMVMVTTVDEQTLAGSIAEEDGQKLVLNMVGQKTTVPKSDIVSRQPSEFSMMPAGLLQTLTQEEVLDLFRYMQAKEQVALP
ncbi:MAG: ThuA domain-containing protein [Verrucomicrobiota bacterium]